MSKEKVIFSLLAAGVGLIVASLAFYFYQGTKSIPTSKSKSDTVNITLSSPTPKPSIYLLIDEPKDEGVFDKKIITVSGKTTADAIIVILTKNDEQVLEPSILGNFSTTVTLDNGENLIGITAIGKNGESTTVNRTVTFSTESF